MPTPGAHPDKIFSPIAILGTGAVGGFLACVVERAGAEVVCVTSKAGVARITQSGISLRSNALGDYAAHVKAKAVLSARPQILFITTKAQQLSQALERIPPPLVQDTIVIPLLNGLEHVSQIRNALGANVAVGMISIEVSRAEDYTIVHSSPHARIELASDRDIARERLEHVSTFLTRAGIECKTLPTEAQVIWRKLVRLNAIALATAASQQPLGVVRTHPQWRAYLEQCAHDAGQVSACDGVPIDSATVMQQIDALPATLTTSLQRDTARNIPSELDAIAGGILRRAAQFHLTCPTIQALYTRIEKRELGL